MPENPVARLRKICLALPEATEKLTWEDTETFRVRDRIFSMCAHGYEDQPTMWCKALPGAQDVLVGADPARFFVPPYVGKNGWIGVRLLKADWNMVADLVLDSYKMTAPKRLIALLP